MYSPTVRKVLSSAGIMPGDLVRIRKSGKDYEGVLLPSPNSSTSTVMLKLKSGYNMGVDFRGASISRLRRARAGLGKVDKRLLRLDFDPKKPKVALVAAGGTIASRVDYRTGGVTALEDPREFLHNVPELRETVNIHSISRPETMMSEDMGHEDWILLAREVHRHLRKSEGVMVTHGTDTMHYTSAALSFFLQGPGKPVVLVGAQKSADRGSSDAGLNLVCASIAATSQIAEVGTCMHGSIDDSHCLFIRGTKVRKMHSVRRDAFRPINDLPLARIFPDGNVEVLNREHSERGTPGKLDARFEPSVALLKAYPSSDPSVIAYLIKKGCRGLVVEGTGLGHVPTQARKSWIPQIKSAVSSGIPVVVTSQTIYGRVNSSVYSNLRTLYREAGAIPGEDMLPEVAYVKLGWVLARTRFMEKVRERMLENVAGEINRKSLPETFLY